MFLVVSGFFRENSTTHALFSSLEKAEEFVSSVIPKGDWLDIRQFTVDAPPDTSYPSTVSTYWWDSKEDGGWVKSP